MKVGKTVKGEIHITVAARAALVARMRDTPHAKIFFQIEDTARVYTHPNLKRIIP